MDDAIKHKTRQSSARLEWTYERIRPFLMTGDQVLFKGKGFLSGLISWFSGGKFSHIGTVVKNQYEVQLLESDWGKAVHGLQLSMLGEKIGTYSGEVCIRFLNCPRSAEWYQTLYKYIEDHRGTSYEWGIGGFFELLGAAFRINKENANRLFCSETSADIFKLWRYLPKYVASNNYTPEDFGEGKKVDVYLREASMLLPGNVSLSPCQRIVRP